MRLVDIISVIDAKVVAGNPDQVEISNGFCSDLMSDVLTIDTDKMLLITGLTNVQTIRTAEVADVTSILLVRNKKATKEMIELAVENGMILLETSYSMFRAAGELYKSGLNPVY